VANVHLVCEGPADGLDRKVLSLLVVGVHSVAVQVSAAGGDTSLRGVAAWLEEHSRHPLPDGSLGPPRDVAVGIEDRNYPGLRTGTAKFARRI
jgi:hypothetical protein